MEEALRNFEGEIRYFKIEKKENKISSENPLIKRYFSELQNS